MFTNLIEYDITNDINYYHPIIHELEYEGKIESVKIVNESIVDDLPSFDVLVVVNGTEYMYTNSRLSSIGVKMYYQAECNNEDAIRQLTTHIVEHKTLDC